MELDGWECEKDQGGFGGMGIIIKLYGLEKISVFNL